MRNAENPQIQAQVIVSQIAAVRGNRKNQGSARKAYFLNVAKPPETFILQF